MRVFSSFIIPNTSDPCLSFPPGIVNDRYPFMSPGFLNCTDEIEENIIVLMPLIPADMYPSKLLLGSIVRWSSYILIVLCAPFIVYMTDIS